MITNICAFIMFFEGFSAIPYVDTTGNTTIGVGLNISDPAIAQITNEIGINKAFTNIVESSLKYCEENFKNFKSLPVEIQYILIDMRFNLGETRFAKFIKFKEAILNFDFNGAASEIKNSRYYYQVGNRAKKHIDTLENCVKLPT